MPSQIPVEYFKTHFQKPRSPNVRDAMTSGHQTRKNIGTQISRNSLGRIEKQDLGFHVDRILPLPQPIREAVIKLYIDDTNEIQEETKNDVDNKHFLVRIFLGENETSQQQSNCDDSLSNFPMRLNMIEDRKRGSEVVP